MRRNRRLLTFSNPSATCEKVFIRVVMRERVEAQATEVLEFEGNLVVLEPVAVQLLVVASHLLHQQLHPLVVLVVVKQDVGKRSGLSQSVVVAQDHHPAAGFCRASRKSESVPVEHLVLVGGQLQRCRLVERPHGERHLAVLVGGHVQRHLRWMTRSQFRAKKNEERRRTKNEEERKKHPAQALLDLVQEVGAHLAALVLVLVALHPLRLRGHHERLTELHDAVASEPAVK